MSRSLLAVLLAVASLTLSLGAMAGPGSKEGPPPPPVKTPEWLTLDGYFRARGGLYINHDLDRGSTPSTGEPIFPIPPSGGQVMGSLDGRLRLDLGVHIGDAVSVHARIDALDNVAAGSTPEGYPRTRWTPMVWASPGAAPPSDGVNAFTDSIRLKRAYGQLLTPVGMLRVGRMGLPRWGLGMIAAGSDGLDDDFDDAVDRITFATSFRDHFLGAAFDINAIGPTTASSVGYPSGRAIDLELKDNVYTVSAGLGRDTADHAILRRAAAGKGTVDYGLYATYRWQLAEFPAFYLDGPAGQDQEWTTDDALQRKVKALAIDLWFRAHVGRLRVEFEGAFVRGRIGNAAMDAGLDVPPIDSTQYGGILQLELDARPAPLAFQLELGLASGDPAPGLGIAPPLEQVATAEGDLDGPQFHFNDDLSIDNLRFHPNHTVDVVFWRQIAGTVTDAFYARGELCWHAAPTLDVSVAGIPSWAVRPRSTPTGQPHYGGEVDLHLRWRPVDGFEWWTDVGVFFPGHALDNPDRELRAKPAVGMHTLLAFTY